MRKFLFAIIALTSMVFVSCAKEDSKNSIEPTDNATTHTMTVTTTGVTKTQFSGDNIIWSTGDKIRVVEAVTGGTDGGKFFPYESSAGTTGDGGAHMSFPVTLTSHDGATGFQYIALYPSTAFQAATSFTNVTVNTPSEQNPSSDQYDKAADFLISQVSPSVAAQPSTLSMAFARKIAIGKMTVKNLASDEYITSVTFSAKKGASDVVLAGRSTVNYTTAAVNYGTANQKKSITLDYTGDNVQLNTIDGSPLYFMCYPFALGASDQFTVVIETATKRFTKEVTLTGAQTLELTAGNVARFAVNMSGIVAENKVDFEYSKASWLTSQSIAIPADGTGTNLDGSYQTESPVRVLAMKKTGSDPKLWNASSVYELRIYKKNHIVVGSYNDKVITKIIFTGTTSLSCLSTTKGTFDASSKTWTGESAQVDFTVADDASTTKISSIKVFYKDVEAASHEFYAPLTAINVPYDATSATIPFFTANAIGLSVSSESAGYVSGTLSVANGTVDVSLTANTSTSPRDIEVTISCTNPAHSEDVIITQAGAPVYSIDAIKALYTSAPVPFTATLTDALVTIVSGDNFYLQDASGAILGFTAGHGLSVGDKLNGTITGNVTDYNGTKEITGFVNSASKTTGHTVTPLTVAHATLVDNFADYESKYVKVENLTVSAVSGKDISVSENANLKIRNESGSTITVGTIMNAVGAPGFYNTTKQVKIYSLDDADLINIGSVINATDKGVLVGGTTSIGATTNSPATITYVSGNTSIATVNESGVITGVAAGSTTITCSVAASGKYLATSKVINVTVTGGAVNDYYQLVTSVASITAGTYVVGALRSTTATNDFYFGKNVVSSGDWVVSSDCVTVSEVGGVREFLASTLPSGAVEFTLTGDNTNGFTISNGTDYLYYTADSNRKLAFASTGSSQKWKVEAKDSPLITGGIVLSAVRLSGQYVISENSTGTGAIRGYYSATTASRYRAIYLFKKITK